MPFSFGNGDGSGPRQPQAKVDNNKFYDLLGIPKDASEADVKRAYRKLALRAHPDKGGDPEKFKQLSRAHEVLTDPNLRAVYDRGGEEALEGSGGDAGDAGDIFSGLFRQQRREGPRKGPDITHPIEISLDDMYNGRVMKLAITRDARCPDCAGKGTAGAGAEEKQCGDCRGRGMVMQVHQLGPGMIQQVSAPCGACKGQGRIIPEGMRCRGACGGKKSVKERKVMEVHIEKGAKMGSKILFRGEAGENPGSWDEPGDVIFVIQGKDHPVFKRDGNDLFVEKDIHLVEALAGTSFTLTHLSRKRLRVVIPPGECIAPGAFKMVEGGGMPLPGGGGLKMGDLYIKFSVIFPPPKSMSLSDCDLLRSILPGPRRTAESVQGPPTTRAPLTPPPPNDAMEDDEVVILTDATVESRTRRVKEQAESTHQPSYDSDEEEGGPRGGQRVQCAQQ